MSLLFQTLTRNNTRKKAFWRMYPVDNIAIRIKGHFPRRNLDNALYCQGFALENEDESKMKRLITSGITWLTEKTNNFYVVQFFCRQSLICNR